MDTQPPLLIAAFGGDAGSRSQRPASVGRSFGRNQVVLRIARYCSEPQLLAVRGKAKVTGLPGKCVQEQRWSEGRTDPRRDRREEVGAGRRETFVPISGFHSAAGGAVASVTCRRTLYSQARATTT